MSSCSSLSYEKDQALLDEHVGSHKVKYQPHREWDYQSDGAHKPVDLALVLPHYRALNQPVDHRMGMFVGNETGPIKVKVCRQFPRCKFYLEIRTETSDVTIWLPSDFRGHIHYTGKPSFSAGFINRILSNVHINEQVPSSWNGDDVVISTSGRISFRMWDINTCAPENSRKEAVKRLFGCSTKAPETAIDWDFLLED